MAKCKLLWWPSVYAWCTLRCLDLRGHPWEPVMVRHVPIWECAKCVVLTTLCWLREAQLTPGCVVTHYMLSTYWLMGIAHSGLSTCQSHAVCSAHAKSMLRAQHVLWPQDLPNHAGNTPRFLPTPGLQERGMPAVTYPTPHFTSLRSGTDSTDKLFTYYNNLEPSLPWKGGWARGPGPACTPISLGADPSPSWAGPRAIASGWQGPR